MTDDRALGFHSLSLEDETATELAVEGHLPGWLEGTLIRNGPGAFELGGAAVDHWFDGLAMLQRFTFSGAGTIDYQNRFLRTTTFERALEGSFTGGFATGESTLRERLWGVLFGEPYDNTNVIAERLGDQYLALTETLRQVEFDPVTLETLGSQQYDGPAPTGQLACAHLRRDPDTGVLWNFETKFGRSNAYLVYSIDPGGKRTPVTTVPVDEPAYMHSFALTPDYVILTEFPFVVDPMDFLKPGRLGPFIDSYRWEPERGTRFTIVDRESGELVGRPTTEAFFGFHHANAYQADGEVVIDLETLPDVEAVGTLTVDGLRAGDLDVVGGSLERFRLDPTDGDGATIARQRLHEGTALPTISPAQWTKPHHYVYAQRTDQPVMEWPTGVVKIDTESGSGSEFDSGADHFGEPIFVPNPDGSDEDDGVILALALDVDDARSDLVILDGASLTEIARASLPRPIPFDFHGRFFPEVNGV